MNLLQFGLALTLPVIRGTNWHERSLNICDLINISLYCISVSLTMIKSMNMNFYLPVHGKKKTSGVYSSTELWNQEQGV